VDIFKVIIIMVLFVLQHEYWIDICHVGQYIKHKVSSYKHNITHRFSTVIYTLPNSGAKLTQCRKLTTQTETTNKRLHNIRGNSEMVNIYKHAFTFSTPPGDRTRDLSIPRRTLYHCSTPDPGLRALSECEVGLYYAMCSCR